MPSWPSNSSTHYKECLLLDSSAKGIPLECYVYGACGATERTPAPVKTSSLRQAPNDARNATKSTSAKASVIRQAEVKSINNSINQTLWQDSTRKVGQLGLEECLGPVTDRHLNPDDVRLDWSEVEVASHQTTKDKECPVDNDGCRAAVGRMSKQVTMKQLLAGF